MYLIIVDSTIWIKLLNIKSSSGTVTCRGYMQSRLHLNDGLNSENVIWYQSNYFLVISVSTSVSKTPLIFVFASVCFVYTHSQDYHTVCVGMGRSPFNTSRCRFRNLLHPIHCNIPLQKSGFDDLIQNIKHIYLQGTIGGNRPISVYAKVIKLPSEHILHWVWTKSNRYKNNTESAQHVTALVS